jgi:predicted MFS family arabinose efflux permease
VQVLFSRTTTTWLLYIVMGCLGFLLNGLGAILQPLERGLGVSPTWVSFYPALFAVGLLLVGLIGAPLTTLLGRDLALRCAMALFGAGAIAICLPQREISIIGAAVAGAGGALLIQIVPTALAAAHPDAAPIAIGESNALSSMASVAAPLAVAGGLATGIGWQFGYLLPIPFLLAAIVLLRLPRRTGPAGTTTLAQDPRGGFLGRWFDVLLAVSVEFCMVFWSAVALQTWTGVDQSTGIALSATFLVGMAVGRTVSSPVLRYLRTDRSALIVACTTALLGFALFWSGAAPALAVTGLLVTGLGIALLYPITVARAIASRPASPDRAAARCALASGLAIGGAPLLLAQLARHLELHIAYLLAPALLLVILLRCLRASPQTTTSSR